MRIVSSGKEWGADSSSEGQGEERWGDSLLHEEWEWNSSNEGQGWSPAGNDSTSTSLSIGNRASLAASLQTSPLSAPTVLPGNSKTSAAIRGLRAVTMLLHCSKS